MGRDQQDVSQLGNVAPYEFVASDNSKVPRIRTRGGDFSAVEISSEILKTLAHRAERNLGGELDGVVITVPAYFDDALTPGDPRCRNSRWFEPVPSFE